MPLYTPEQRERAARNINLPPNKYFDEFGFIRDTQPNVDNTALATAKTSDTMSPLETFIGSGLESVLPSLGGLGAGMATGAAGGSVWPGLGTFLGALGGAILGGGAISYGQDKLANYIAPETMKRLREGQAENTYAAGIGAFAGSLPTFGPTLKPIQFLSETAKRKIMSMGHKVDTGKVVEALADVGLGAGVEAGMSVATDIAQDREVSLPRAALMGTLGAVVSQPTKLATKLTGATPFEAPLDSAEYIHSGLGVGPVPARTKLLQAPTEDSLSVAGEASRGQPVGKNKYPDTLGMSVDDYNYIVRALNLKTENAIAYLDRQKPKYEEALSFKEELLRKVPPSLAKLISAADFTSISSIKDLNTKVAEWKKEVGSSIYQPISELKTAHGDKGLTTAYVNKINDFLETYRNAHLSTIDLQDESRGAYNPTTREMYADPKYANFQTPLHEGMHMMIDDLVTSEAKVDRRLVDLLFKTVEDSKEFNEWADTPFLRNGETPRNYYKGKDYDGRPALVEEFIAERGGWNVAMEILKTANKKSWFDVVKHLKKKWTTGLDSEDYNWALAQRFLYDRAYPTDKLFTTLPKGRQQPLDDEDDWSESNYENFGLKQQLARERAAKEKAAKEAGQAEGRQVQEVQGGTTQAQKTAKVAPLGAGAKSIQDSPLYREMAAKVKRREDGEELLRLRTQLTEGEGAKRLRAISYVRPRDLADLKMAASKVRHKSLAIEELMAVPIWEPDTEKLRTLIGNVLPDIIMDARGTKARAARAKKVVDTFYGKGVFDALEGSSRIARGESLAQPLEEGDAGAKKAYDALFSDSEEAKSNLRNRFDSILAEKKSYIKDDRAAKYSAAQVFVADAVRAVNLAYVNTDEYLYRLWEARNRATNLLARSYNIDTLDFKMSLMATFFGLQSSGRYTPYEQIKLRDKANELLEKGNHANKLEEKIKKDDYSLGIRFSSVPDNLEGLNSTLIWKIADGKKPFDIITNIVAGFAEETPFHYDKLKKKYEELYLRYSNSSPKKAIDDLRKSLPYIKEEEFRRALTPYLWPYTANSIHLAKTLTKEQLDKPLIFGGPNNTRIEIPLHQAASEMSLEQWTELGTDTKFPSIKELREVAKKAYQDSLTKDNKPFPPNPKITNLTRGIRQLRDATDVKQMKRKYNNCIVGYIPQALRGDTFLYETASAVAEIRPDGGLVQHLGDWNRAPSDMDKEAMLRFAEANPDLYLADTAWHTTRMDYEDTILGERARNKGIRLEQPLENQQFTREVREKLGEEEANAYHAAFNEARLRDYDEISLRNIAEIESDLADRLVIAAATEQDPFFALRQSVGGGKAVFQKDDNKTIEARRWKRREQPVEDRQFFTTELERELRKNPKRPFGLQLRKDGTIRADQLASVLRMKLPRAEQEVLGDMFKWLEDKGQELVDPLILTAKDDWKMEHSLSRDITTDTIDSSLLNKEKGIFDRVTSNLQQFQHLMDNEGLSVRVSTTHEGFPFAIYGGSVNVRPGFARTPLFAGIHGPRNINNIDEWKVTFKSDPSETLDEKQIDLIEAYIKNKQGQVDLMSMFDDDAQGLQTRDNVRWDNILPRKVDTLPDYTELSVQHNQPGERLQGDTIDTHYFPTNTMTHVRGYMHTDEGTGEKTFVILEAQSDWDASIRDTNERRKRELPDLEHDLKIYEGILRDLESIVEVKPSLEHSDSYAGFDKYGNEIVAFRASKESVQNKIAYKLRIAKSDVANQKIAVDNAREGINKPFLENWQATALKAAIRHAVKEGADRIAITDAPTSMITQGHIGYPLTKKFPSALAAESYANDPSRREWDMDAYQDYSTKEWFVRAEPWREGAMKEARDAGFRVEREMGHRVNYETKLPSIMKKLVGDKGELRTYGDTDAIGEDAITLAKLGAEDFSLRARSYKLSDEVKSKFLNEQTQMFSDRFQPIEETPAFEKWFDGSKVVDKEGKPLRIYHLTTQAFSEFKPGGNNPKLSGNAMWFSPDPTEIRASHNVQGRYERYRKGTNTMPVYASIKNPLILDGDTLDWARDIFHKDIPFLMPERLVKELKAENYDGVLYYEGEKLAEVIAFDPKQIKSAIGNRGTFDPADPDIRHQPLDTTLPEPTAKGWKIAPDSFLESRVKKVSKLGESGSYLADKMNRYYAKRGFYEGDFANTAAMFFDGYVPPKGSEDKIVRFLHDIRHKGKSKVNLTDQEAHIVMLWKEHLKEIGDKHKAIGMLIKEGPKAFREMVQDPNYSPDMVDPEVVYYMTHNRASSDPRARKLKDDFIDWALQKSDMNDKEALEYYNNYMDAVSGVRDLAGNNDRAYFGALRRAKSIGLPYSWVEKNPIRLFYRYGRRTAHDFAFFEELQNDPTARWVSGLVDQEGNRPSELPIDSIAENPEVQSAMQGIILGDSPYRGADQLTHARIASAARVVSNVIMGAGTGARDIFTLPGTMAPYLQNFGDLKAVLKGARRTFKVKEKALRSGSTQLDYDAFQFGDLEYAAPDRIVRNLSKASKFFRKYQGRQLLENVSRQLTYAIGEEIAATKIAQAKAGDKKAKKWLETFTKSVDDLTAPDTVSRIAKEFTDRVQGAYDARNLPGIALEGEIAPFLNLARWSIEKYNVVKEDVFKPMTEGDFKPLLMYTLGSMLSAVAIEKLNELLSNKRGHDATIKEVWKSPDASLDDYVYKIIALGQLGAFAGIASDATKLATATVTGRTSYNNPLSFPLYTFVTETLADNLSDATEAIKEGEDPVNTLLNMTHAIAKGSLQNYRYVSSWYDHKETKRKEKFRDLAVWKQLNDETDALKEVRVNRFLKQGERKFKQSDDLEESTGMLEGLITKAFERAKGDPFRFKQELAGLKANSYQTMPSPKTMPNSFAKYLLHLRETQGEEAANARLQDWMLQNAKNRVKSGMVP